MQSYIPDCMMSNIQEDDPHSQDLAMFLKQNISKSVKKFKASHQAQISRNDTASPIMEPTIKGKMSKNLMLLEEPISFALPEDCDISHLKDMDKVLPKLEGWKIEIKQRDTKTCDTFYSHPSSSRKLRSITEVVNHILPESYSRLQRRKRSKAKEGTSNNQKRNHSPWNNSSMEISQCQPEVRADSALEYQILDDEETEQMIQELLG